MIDFLMISTRSTKRGVIEIYPKFIIKKSSDLDVYKRQNIGGATAVRVRDGYILKLPRAIPLN